MDTVREMVRHYARSVARFVHKASRGQVSANTFTYTSLAGHIPTAFLIGSGHWLWAAALLLFFGLFDVLDGEMARLQKTASSRGMLLDATTDRIKEILLYTGAAYWISNSSYAAWSYLVVLACGSSLLVSYVKAKGESAVAVSLARGGHHKLNRTFSFGVAAYEVRMFILLLGLVSDQLIWAVGIVAILASYTALERLIIISKHV
jgi:CDP-diacylglycerol--glycerol-3-phosphate 3-phosphatidyltransferase